MGQGHSRQRGRSKEKNKNVPPGSPLGDILDDWNRWETTKKFDQVRMIFYCAEHWPKRKLQQKSLKWPWYGSRDKWLCKLLYQQVCNQENPNSEEVCNLLG